MAALQARQQLSGLKAGPAARVASGVSRQRVVSVSAAVKAKATAKSAAYVCLECGYLYTGSEPFESLKNYACPVCAAPKRRFKELRGNTLRNNDAKSLQARKAKLIEQVEADGGSADEGANEFLIATGLIIAATVAGLAYFNLQ